MLREQWLVVYWCHSDTLIYSGWSGDGLREWVAGLLYFLSVFSHSILSYAFKHSEGSSDFRSFRWSSRQKSYWHGLGSRPLLSLTTYDVLRRTADAKGDKKAVVSCHQGLIVDYSTFKDDVSSRETIRQ